MSGTTVTRRWKPYPAYKNSGVEWLEQVPERWEIVPFTKYISEQSDYRGKTPEKTLSGIFLVTAKNIRMGYIDYETSQEFVSEDDYEDIMRRGLPKVGDILFTTEAPLGNVALVDREDVAMAQRVIRFRMQIDRFLARFILYVMMSQFFQIQLKSLATGSTAKGLKASKLSLLKIVRIPLGEQHTIAAYLDRACSLINAAIAKKRRLLELLEEKRRAAITQAVTRGLDPSVPMKDSGVEWLENVPEEWEIKRLKFCIARKLQYGANIPAELDDSNLPRYIRITDMNDSGTLKDDTFRSIPLDQAKPYLLNNYDILLARSGTVGKSFIYKESMGIAAYAGYLIRVSANKDFCASFLYAFFNSVSYWQWINSIFIQTTIQNVNAEKYGSLYIPVPPHSEQLTIAAFLDSTCSLIDAQRRAHEKSISLLQEYRSSLITHAVTGKIDVRNAVHKELQ